MEKVEVTLLLCTLYKEKPHGLAIIECTYPDDDHLSFKGVGMFNEGILHSTPFIWVDRHGYGYSYTNMHNGRPAHNCFCTFFYDNECTQHVDSCEEETYVSGWQYFSGQIDKELRNIGQGKYWENDGSIYIGLF